MRIGIINGPNLNLLGKREPGIYGTKSFEEYLSDLKTAYPQLEFHYFQSNEEAAILDSLHKMSAKEDFIILNAAAYTHTSVAIGDAVAAVSVPVIEVHISNVYQREPFRHHSYISPHAAAVIIGAGLSGYRLAVEYCLLQS